MKGRAVGRLVLSGTAILAGLMGCATSDRGWDSEGRLATRPELAAFPGHRLHDMTPYPALNDGRLQLVTCRSAGDGPVWVEGVGSALPREWVERAAASLSGGPVGVDLRLVPLVDRPVGASPALIRVEIVASADAPAPRGLGDTLVECDVSPSQPDSVDRVAGRLTGAVIRMRRAQRAQTGVIHWVKEEEWIGALMHEFGHALGFAGHVRIGDSIMVRDESRLRAVGRRAAAGSAQSDATLEALFRLPAGLVLGEVPLSDSGRQNVAALEDRVAEWTEQWGAPEGPIATVGDRRARMRWHWPEKGERLELVFPRWVEEVRGGKPVTAIPNAATRRRLARPELFGIQTTR